MVISNDMIKWKGVTALGYKAYFDESHASYIHERLKQVPSFALCLTWNLESSLDLYPLLYSVTLYENLILQSTNHLNIKSWDISLKFTSL